MSTKPMGRMIKQVLGILFLLPLISCVLYFLYQACKLYPEQSILIGLAISTTIGWTLLEK